MTYSVAVIGLGTVGRSWAAVFARAGLEVRAWDPSGTQVAAVHDWLAETGIPAGRVTVASSLEDAVAGVGYVQESGPEPLQQKQALFARLDRAAPADTILASSTSANDMTDIATGLLHPGRCVVAHPVNPPHVIPVVEVLGGTATSTEVVERTCAFLTSVGQQPVRLHRHVAGFLLNRLQAAVIREALSLLDRGIADVASIDAVMHQGLGLRWAFLGPFGTSHLNADGGIGAYYDRFWEPLRDLMDDLGPTPELTDALRQRMVEQTTAMFDDDVETLQRSRDAAVQAVHELKRQR